MICNSYGIDDIQRQAVDFPPLLCYNKPKGSEEMALQKIEINNVTILFNKEKTQNNQTDYNRPCDCQDCRNYYKNIENNNELIEFLTGFGVDYLRAEEIMPIDLGNEKESLINYSAYYCVVGSISKVISIKKEDFSVSFGFSSNINVGHEISDDYFFIVVDIDLPYILDEEREFPPLSFIEKCIDKFKLFFKRK